MALLALAFFLGMAQPAFADMDMSVSTAVFYDAGNSDNSIALVDDTILELDDIYDQYRVRGFAADAVIFEHLQTYDSSRLPVKGEQNPRLWNQARELFIVKQLKDIHLAQIRYFREKKDHFAEDLETLLVQGDLPDGFTDQVKQDYYFEIIKSGQNPRRAPHYEQDYFFLAAASPLGEGRRLYFTVDELGQVRYGDNGYLAEWGPVWDYTDFDVPRTRDIQVDA